MLEEIEKQIKLETPKKKYASYKNKQRISLILSYVGLSVLAFIWLIPIFWMILTAFRYETNDLGEFSGILTSSFFPKALGLDSFFKLFLETEFLRWFLNTFAVAIATCILSTVIVISVSYVMSKVRFKMRKPFMNIAMILGLFPGFMSIIAVYFILKMFGLTGSLVALVICYSAGAGLGFYISKGFFDTIPNTLLESAKLDGANSFTTFYKIILPLSKPTIIYTIITSFTGPWMDFIFAKVIIGDTNVPNYTVSVGLYQMIFGSISDASMFTTFIAGCILVSIPIIVLFLLTQRYYVEGVTAGAVKG
jgi:arabinogalactan oligomer/maltooligosaccharide transport system permease protein